MLSGSFVNAVNSSRPIVNTLNARLPNVVLLSVVSARSVNAVNNASAASGPSVNAPRCLTVGPATEKQPKEQARATVRAAFEASLPVRAAAELTGWSIGWVSSRYQQLREHSVDRTLQSAAR